MAAATTASFSMGLRLDVEYRMMPPCRVSAAAWSKSRSWLGWWRRPAEERFIPYTTVESIVNE